MISLIDKQPHTASAAPSAQAAELSLSVLGKSSADIAMSAWREIEFNPEYRESENCGSLTCGSLWTETWLEHYADAVPHQFLLASVEGHPVGVTLVTNGVGQKDGPLRVHTKHLGTAGERPGESVCVEYNKLHALPQYRAAFEDAVISHILQDKAWDSFRLDGFTPEDARQLMQDLPGAELRRRESPYYDLKATREAGVELLSRLGRSTRQNTRRLLRNYGELTTEWANDTTTATEIFAELMTLHQARWESSGMPGAFASRRFSRFQQSLISKSFALPAKQRPVVLFRLKHQQATVGCLMLLVDGNRMLDYISGFASFEEQPSPGIMTHYHCMEEALSRGFDAYDFLVGEKRHKENLSTDKGELVWASWTRPSLKSRMIGAVRSLKRRMMNFRTVDDAK